MSHIYNLFHHQFVTLFIKSFQPFLFSYFINFKVYENLSEMFFLPSSSYSQFSPPTFL